MEKDYGKIIKLMEENTIGKRIQQARTRKGLTQAQLAKMVGRSQRAISQYETGLHDVSASDIPLLAKALSESILYFFEGTTENRDTVLEQSLLQEFRKLPTTDSRQAIIELVRSFRRAIESNY